MDAKHFFFFLKICCSPTKQFNTEARKGLLLAHAGFSTEAEYGGIIYSLSVPFPVPSGTGACYKMKWRNLWLKFRTLQLQKKPRRVGVCLVVVCYCYLVLIFYLTFLGPDFMVHYRQCRDLPGSTGLLCLHSDASSLKAAVGWWCPLAL